MHKIKKPTAYLCLVLMTSLFSGQANAQSADISNEKPTIRIDPTTGQSVPIYEPKTIKVRIPTEREKVEQALGRIKSMALTTQDYKDLKTLNLDVQKSQVTPYPSTAKPITRSLALNLDPGVQPPVLRLSQGMQTSIVFSDGNGQAWNIESVSYNKGMFEDDRGQGEGSDSTDTNILSLSPKNPAAYGNVSIKLKGLSTPVMFVLTTGQSQVDFRVDAKVPGGNPDSTYHTVSSGSYPSIDENMMGFLDGVPPSGAKELKFEEARGARAWSYQNNLYIKTRGTVAYPAYMAAAKSTSGANVYRFNGIKQSVTLMQDGQIFSAYPKTR